MALQFAVDVKYTSNKVPLFKETLLSVGAEQTGVFVGVAVKVVVVVGVCVGVSVAVGDGGMEHTELS
jgi:hypothetical protein